MKDVDAEVSVVMKAVVLCSLNITAQCSFRLVFALCVLVMYSIQQFSHLVDTVSKILSLFYCTVWFLWYTLVTVTFEGRLFQCVCVDMRRCFPDCEA